MYQPSEVAVKISSKSNISNPAKHYISYKSLSGVFEDMRVPDKSGDGVRLMGASYDLSVRVSSRTNISKTSRYQIQNKPFL